VRPAPARPAAAPTSTPTAAPTAAPAPAAKAPSATPSPSPEDNDLDFNAETRTAAPAPKRGETRARAEPPKPAEPPRVAQPPKGSEPLRVAEPTLRREPPPAAAEPASRTVAPTPRPSTTGLGAARSLEGGVAAARAQESAPPSKPAAPSIDTSLPDFSLDIPPAGSTDGTSRGTPPGSDFNMDFNLEPLPAIDLPELKPSEAAAPATPAEPAKDLDFKLDDISLDFGGRTPARDTPKDDHWYDVQQKFDLAKAYEEMGDKAGARDILQEVVKEGDAEQQAQAKKLLGRVS
jgi:pilus assembly protein FimV